MIKAILACAVGFSVILSGCSQNPNGGGSNNGNRTSTQPTFGGEVSQPAFGSEVSQPAFESEASQPTEDGLSQPRAVLSKPQETSMPQPDDVEDYGGETSMPQHGGTEDKGKAPMPQPDGDEGYGGASQAIEAAKTPDDQSIGDGIVDDNGDDKGDGIGDDNGDDNGDYNGDGIGYVEAKVIVSGKEIAFGSQAAIIKDGEVFVPVMGVFEHLDGANGNKNAPFFVNWDDTTATATIRNQWYTVIATSGEQGFTCNGNRVTSAAPPQTINGELMLPLTAIAKAIDATAQWDDENSAISIFYESMVIAY